MERGCTKESRGARWIRKLFRPKAQQEIAPRNEEAATMLLAMAAKFGLFHMDLDRTCEMLGSRPDRPTGVAWADWFDDNKEALLSLKHAGLLPTIPVGRKRIKVKILVQRAEKGVATLEVDIHGIDTAETQRLLHNIGQFNCAEGDTLEVKI